jgi:heme-degrading monooxygenase HmoA
MTNLLLLRVGVPRGTTAEAVWDELRRHPALQRVVGARLYQPTRGFFEPTEWIYCGDVDEPVAPPALPADRLPLRKLDLYPFRGEINPFGLDLLGSSMPMQLVTITAVEPMIERFEAWYAEHAAALCRAPGATGARRYWQDGVPRRYASLYYYESDEGVERYYASEARAKAAQSRLVFDPWLVDQHHAYYEDVTPPATRPVHPS